MAVKKMGVIKDLKLKSTIIRTGSHVNAYLLPDGNYKIFHHTGWWWVPVEYLKELYQINTHFKGETYENNRTRI